MGSLLAIFCQWGVLFCRLMPLIFDTFSRSTSSCIFLFKRRYVFSSWKGTLRKETFKYWNNFSYYHNTAFSNSQQTKILLVHTVLVSHLFNVKSSLGVLLSYLCYRIWACFCLRLVLRKVFKEKALLTLSNSQQMPLFW